MKKFFKKAVAMLAMLGLIGNAMPLSVSAVKYEPGDIDHDGYVTAADASFVHQYLCGLLSSANYNEYDVDQNLIVDHHDLEYINTIVLGKDGGTRRYYSRKYFCTMPAVTVPENPELNIYAGSTESRTYRRYSYKDKKELKAYTLTPSTATVNTGRTVVGTDERKQKTLNENTGIVHLTCNKHNGKTSVSTGFIVGDHVIATAAHCVYWNKEDEVTGNMHNEFYDNITIELYGKDGKLNGKKLTAVEAHIWEKYPEDKNAYVDYALITVEENLSELDCFQFDLGTAYNVNPTSYRAVPIYATGCPGHMEDESGKEKFNEILYTAEGRISDKSNVQLCFDVDVTKGQSGSPLYTITKNKLKSENKYGEEEITVLGICNKENVDLSVNYGCPITSYQIQFYKYNAYLNY